MSKYIKLEDALNCVNGYFLTGVHKAIKSLPTNEVSEDCISKEYLEEQLQQIEDITAMAHIDLGENPYDETEEITMPISTVRKIFKNAPSVVPSRAEGEWVKKQEKYQMAECSNCKKVTMHEMWGDKLVYYDYCPNCGAKMKGARNEDC